MPYQIVNRPGLPSGHQCYGKSVFLRHPCRVLAYSVPVTVNFMYHAFVHQKYLLLRANYSHRWLEVNLKDGSGPFFYGWRDWLPEAIQQVESSPERGRATCGALGSRTSTPNTLVRVLGSFIFKASVNRETTKRATGIKSRFTDNLFTNLRNSKSSN